MDATGPLLTLTTNEDPLVLTKVAQIVAMDVRGREHVQFRGKDYKLGPDQEPVPVRGTLPVIPPPPLTVIMILRFTMSIEDYYQFGCRVGENSFLLLTVDAGQGLTLTKNARIVEMDMLSRPSTPVVLSMTLHGDMTREDYDKFERLIVNTPGAEMTVDINKTRDGHFRAQIKTKQGERS